MRGVWLLLTAVPFLCTVEAGGAETVAPVLAPLPEGDHGIAAKYPDDMGIERDPAVVLHDGFEDCAKSSDLGKKWDILHDARHMRIAEEPANVHHGKRAVEFVLPQQQEGRAVAMNKILKEERDVLSSASTRNTRRATTTAAAPHMTGGRLRPTTSLTGKQPRGFPLMAITSSWPVSRAAAEETRRRAR